MSYFAIAAGTDLSGQRIPGVAFVPIGEAQDYVRRLSSRIVETDGEPAYLCDDGESGTSSDFVIDAEDAALDRGSLDGTAMLQLLRLCERERCVLRVWWAGDSATAFDDVTDCRTVSECNDLIVSRAHRRWGLRFAP